MNVTIIQGRVGQDPKVKEFENGKVANFSVAVTERGYKTKDGKEIPERTDWLNIVVRNGLATVAEKYIKKGTAVLIHGKIHNREYEKDGIKNIVTEIHADDLELLGSPDKQENRQADPEPQRYNNDALPF